MKLKGCFKCKGTGVNCTYQRLRRYIAKVPKKFRQKELNDLKKQIPCSVCQGEGVLIYP